MLTIAGTGHRPNKLGGYTDEVYTRLVNLARSWLSENKPTKVISGMALGWDMALAEATLWEGIHLTCAIPFNGQDKMWPAGSRLKYRELIAAGHELVVVSQGDYSPAKMMLRNAWMVNHADKMLALWDGSKGGTGNCVHFATLKGVPVINLWEKYNE